MNILVTGATGFIGGPLVCRLMADGHEVRASTVRLARDADWSTDLRGIDAVVHTAARVHVMRENVSDPLAEFRRVNVEGTLRLAEQAAELGVKRFIFLSSIKVNGEVTKPGEPFTADDSPAPNGAYGKSKLEAEQGLQKIGLRTGMEIVILRPPLVYGPGVKGNMATLARLVARGIPLPLGAIHNKRSLVALDNLIDLIALCINHPAAAHQVFLISDGDDFSTTELLKAVGEAMARRVRLIPVPAFLLHFLGRLTGQSATVIRLCNSLQVDSTKTSERLGWKPPITARQGLRQMVVASVGK